MRKNKTPLFSITASDCEWSYTKGTGSGGQKRNKTSSAVHCIHRPSNAHGYSENSRSQLDNRRSAFDKMANSKEFQLWLRMETMKRLGIAQEIEEEVKRQLKQVKIEIRVDDKWIEVTEDQLTD